MKVLLASDIVPDRSNHSVRAANIVTFELLEGLKSQPGFEVGFLHCNYNEQSPQLSIQDKKNLESQGLTVLPSLKIDLPLRQSEGVFSRIRTLMNPKLEDFYPICSASCLAENAIADWDPDALVIPWSDHLTALFAHCPIPVKYAYHGNPFPKSTRHQQLIAKKFTNKPENYFQGIKSKIQEIINPIRLKQVERFHLQLMSQYDAIGNVAFNDSLYYREHGMNGFYIRNIWFDRYGESALENRRAVELDKNIIIGSIGRPGATANTLGLELIGTEIVPTLRSKLNSEKFSVHILGAGKPLPAVEAILQEHPEIVLRGFVDDIDSTLQQAKVFLVANNGTSYKVGHTRYLHAWSLGCCVVAHADAALSMPEIVHGHNALLGRDSEEIADLICLALHDEKLRRRIGKNGYETFTTLFTKKNVVPEIAKELNRIHQRKGYADVQQQRVAKAA